MSKINYWFRWLAIIPGAFFAGYIINFLLLGFILMFISPERAETFLNIFLFPFTITLIFVLVGTLIAPARKIKTSIILFLLVILLEIPLVFIALPDDKIVEIVSPTKDKIIRLIMAIAGAIIGLYIAKKANKTNN